MGAAGPGMARLHELGLVELMRSLTQPVLGVCLGMQLLCAHSEEGDTACLGLIPAPVRRFVEASGRRVPHMGWNTVRQTRPHPLFKDIGQETRFYFVHSYYADPVDRTIVGGTTTYGREFCSAAMWGNVVAVQFHPEKSQQDGLRIYENFARL